MHGVKDLIDRAEQIALADGSPLGRLTREERRRLIAEAVFARQRADQWEAAR